MVALSGKVIVCGFLLLALLLPAAGEDRNLRSAGNDQFEIVGLHDRSVRYVEELSREIVVVAERYLAREALQFPQRILVSLKPPEYVDFEGDYIVRARKRGFVNLDLRWDESLSLLTTCRALSDGLLVRYSILNYGDAVLDTLPKWPATAIGTKAYLRLRPAQSRQLPAWLDAKSTTTVESLLRRKWSDSVQDFNGYAFLYALEQTGLERKKIRSLIAQSLSGADISDALVRSIQLGDPLAEVRPLNEWWRASFAELLVPAEEPMERMEASRLWIEALSDLSNSEFEDLNLAQLWDERENEALRSMIEARYEILRLRILQVNPAYFNAARSLGALFETYLRGERRHLYVHRLVGFLGDFEDSKELEKAVNRALSEASKDEAAN